MTPKWARLIDQWQREGHLALTPAFMVGALYASTAMAGDTASAYRGLRRLLESMRDEAAPYGRVARVFECQNIHQPVVSLSTDTNGTSVAAPGQTRRLYVWPWYEPERPVDFDWLLQALWCHYRLPITEARYSFHRPTRSFVPFDAADRAFIQRALSDEDEG